jgi:uncharacterized membrane protein (TIGR02234 family)
VSGKGALAKGNAGALAMAVLACAAGAAIVLVAVSRTWGEVIQARPAPLPELREARSGASLFPWLPALALAALAGAGALPATRRASRVAVGVVLVASGLGIVVGSVTALAGADTISGSGGVGLGVGGTAPFWSALCGLGGLAIAASGGIAAARGRDWPSLGTRYERPNEASTRGRHGNEGGASETQLWDALDHGHDPTQDSSRER